jgi:hypothetical protein
MTKSRAPDPFANLEAFRLPQDYATTLGVQKLLLKVPVRRPHRQEFFRVHPDPEFAIDTALIELAEDREWFLASPEVRSALFEEVKSVKVDDDDQSPRRGGPVACPLA